MLKYFVSLLVLSGLLLLAPRPVIAADEVVPKEPSQGSPTVRSTPKISQTSKNTQAQQAQQAQPGSGTSRTFQSRQREGKVPSGQSRSRGGRGAHFGSTYQVPQFTVQANKDSTVLYFYPPNRQVIAGSEPFSSLVIFANPKSLSFDRVFLAISYPAKVMEPVHYEDRLPEDLLRESPKVKVYPSDGILTYEAQLKFPASIASEEILSIEWKAHIPQKNTALSFTSWEERPTGIFNGSQNILGDPGIQDDGIIPADITIFREMTSSFVSEEDDLDDSDEEEEVTIELVSDQGSQGFMEGDGSIRLILMPPGEPVMEGDSFDVQVYFKNPKALLIDNVNLDIRFDPKYMQVVDTDEENWISRGTNILDGPYHEVFPFDYHIKNAAYNQLGRIHYHAGMSQNDALYQEGVMATIRFISIKAGESIPVAFYRNKEGKGPAAVTRGTTLSCSGKDILGAPADSMKGIENTFVTIRPR